MSVATHLGIRLAEYDRRIRTFIPYYEEMLDAAAALVAPRAAMILDLGIGTGALSERCLAVAKRARVTGVDSDAEILRMAARRLGRRAQLIHGRYEAVEFPRADAVVASLALHHIATKARKLAVYRRIYRALRPGGVFISADCTTAKDASLRKQQERVWREHVRRSYSNTQASACLRAWGREDFYMPLGAELRMLEACGFRPEVAWRRGMFAVVAARKAK
ncbi:MAG TPA: class I SAM-dependent methyltransferase [Candidatus Acidoferrales bacterium]|nr:class I SAM-dependent methyltransferase [Candidatus Acidoferrales bacterium]